MNYSSKSVISICLYLYLYLSICIYTPTNPDILIIFSQGNILDIGGYVKASSNAVSHGDYQDDAE